MRERAEEEEEGYRRERAKMRDRRQGQGRATNLCWGGNKREKVEKE